ncbi:hypothetical protein DdX_18986 [Ditylenchus destructor]|uniref:Uncharacterized protein n=1 Tax=Ditylenchus destructor TaxID=166010 RepID=A0AAD4MK65_9BILA|nr:hypothetical protein DdX_18986 [Ditylenchus destructor]
MPRQVLLRCKRNKYFIQYQKPRGNSALPAPFDEEETLPRAVAKGANAYETETPNRLVYAADLPCNDTTPLLLEFISGESHFIAVSVVYHDFYDKQSSLVVPQETTLNSMLINLQPNGSVTVITIMGSSPKKANVTFNETMYQCSVFEDVYKRHAFVKTIMPENSACVMIIVSWIRQERNMNESGGNEPISLCESENGSAAELEYNSERWTLSGTVRSRDLSSGGKK